MNLSNGSAVVGNNSDQVQRLSLPKQVNFLVQFSFEAGLYDILTRGRFFQIIDMPTDAN